MTDDEIKKMVEIAVRPLGWLWFGLMCFCIGGLVGNVTAARPRCNCPLVSIPPDFASPFCQVMGSPVGGRMAQLPEGVGPHD